MQELMLKGVRLLDGLGGERRRVSVVISGARVVRVGDEGESAERVVDLSGFTLMPALVDAHVHLSSYQMLPEPLRGEQPRARALRYFELANWARDLISMGILTVRDVGSEGDHALHLKQALGLGLLSGPRVLTCGRIVSATSPGCLVFGDMYRPADGVAEVLRAAREQFASGADFVKVMATGARSVVLEDPEPAQFAREEVRAVVAEAHRLGKRVAAHSEGLEGTRIAVEEGVDTIEHGLALHRAPDLLYKMAEAGQTLVPTLSTFHDVSEDRAEKYPCTLIEQAKRQREDAYKTLLAARSAGVRLAMGFDSYPLGENARELVRMAGGGIGASAAIVAGTSGAADALGREDLGRVLPGAAADLLVVDGDPLADPAVLLDPKRIFLVLQAGVPVAGSGGVDAAFSGQTGGDH